MLPNLLTCRRQKGGIESFEHRKKRRMIDSKETHWARRKKLASKPFHQSEEHQMVKTTTKTQSKEVTECIRQMV
jgi:multidrug resistance efflux pump